MYNNFINHFYPLICLMSFYVNTFISTKDDIAEKFLLFEIEFVVILNLLVILIWQTYHHISRRFIHFFFKF